MPALLLIEFVNNRLHNCVQELSALANYEPDAQHNGQLCRSYLLHLIYPAKVYATAHASPPLYGRQPLQT